MASSLIDVGSLRKGFARAGGAVPAVGELCGGKNALAHAVVDVKTVAVGKGRDKDGAETSHLRVASDDGIGEISCRFGHFGQGNPHGVGRDGALVAEVGDVETIDIGAGGTLDVAVGVGEELLRRGRKASREFGNLHKGRGLYVVVFYGAAHEAAFGSLKLGVNLEVEYYGRCCFVVFGSGDADILGGGGLVEAEGVNP